MSVQTAVSMHKFFLMGCRTYREPRVHNYVSMKDHILSIFEITLSKLFDNFNTTFIQKKITTLM